MHLLFAEKKSRFAGLVLSLLGTIQTNIAVLLKNSTNRGVLYSSLASNNKAAIGYSETMKVSTTAFDSCSYRGANSITYM